MPRHIVHMSDAAAAALRAALKQLRKELEVPPDFPAPVLAAADAAAAAPRLPDEDATHLPFFTIDPPASKDLDQAMYLERRPGGGFRVHYAIADVAAFVTPGGALDAEAHERVETLYFPDGKVPLHPPAISEGAASLLPDRTVPALLWRHDLDADGRVTHSRVGRALVRSRARLDYAGVQQAIDAGTAEEPVALLRDIGTLREAVEVARGGISVSLPDQEVTLEEGSFRLSYRAALPVEGWNEQISLMTGMAAARMMLDSGTGILRTQKTAEPAVVTRVRAIARVLGIDWPHHVSYADLVRRLDPQDQKHAAFLSEATAMLLKAEYTAFRDHRVPEHTVHAAIAAPYAHCTAPLRRLIDRYTGELCVAACAGQAPPDWVLTALYGLPCDMLRGKGAKADRRSVDLAEAAVLMNRVGQVFEAAVINTDEEANRPREGLLHLADPAVLGRVKAEAALKLGETVRATLRRANPGHPGENKVLFTVP
ncbi:RNB domain-containing ribonuclease [Streptomyces sp. BR123]|uniref:ribonuclease catalytic domain-containing protein n=1 Tax=Streptomyces sp. BR123 TaxID=2749828 RepID=UPI0015C4368B|nr:RNB domain-containing ribonuclease [Streptomyces sp. BR123]NXY98438.1 RNB domain-containing ribonuclease [Streptomyces sp. BR123]